MGRERGYDALHTYLRYVRGKAAAHACVDCGKPATQWSYDRSCPNELTEPNRKTGRPQPYSLDLDRYQPRCVPCHQKFDGATRPFGQRMPTDANGRAYPVKATAVAPFTHTVCGRCKVRKPVASFSTRGKDMTGRKDPYKSQCLACDRERANARYAKLKAQQNSGAA
jgi:hypothetical protein